MKIKCQKIESLGSLLEHMRQYHNNNYGSEMDENEWNREENNEQERQQSDHNYCLSIIKGIIKSFYNIIIINIINILFFFLNIFVALVLLLFNCLLLIISNKTIQKMIALLILILVAFVFWTILKQSAAYIYLKVFNRREPYSLKKTNNFLNLRKTRHLELRYFVEHDFEKRFNRKQIENFESEIESKYEADAHKISGHTIKKSPTYSVSFFGSKKPYCLYKTTKFSNSRKTSRLKNSYFVDHDFEDRFDRKEIENFECQIDKMAVYKNPGY